MNKKMNKSNRKRGFTLLFCLYITLFVVISAMFSQVNDMVSVLRFQKKILAQFTNSSSQNITQSIGATSGISAEKQETQH